MKFLPFLRQSVTKLYTEFHGGLFESEMLEIFATGFILKTDAGMELEIVFFAQSKTEKFLSFLSTQ